MLIDITQEVMSCRVWEGDPVPQKEEILRITKGDVCNLTAFSMCAHNGTHVDAPFHFMADGNTVEQTGLDPDYGAASEAADRRDGMLRDAVRKAGFPADALKTTNFNVTTEYRGVHDPKTGEYRQEFAGYRIFHGMLLAFPLSLDTLAELHVVLDTVCEVEIAMHQAHELLPRIVELLPKLGILSSQLLVFRLQLFLVVCHDQPSCSKSTKNPPTSNTSFNFSLTWVMIHRRPMSCWCL